MLDEEHESAEAAVRELEYGRKAFLATQANAEVNVIKMFKSRSMEIVSLIGAVAREWVCLEKTCR